MDLLYRSSKVRLQSFTVILLQQWLSLEVIFRNQYFQFIYSYFYKNYS